MRGEMKHKHSLLVISFIVIMIIFQSSNLILTVKADTQVEVLTHSSYIDGDGWFNIVGEVENVGDQPVEYVEIQATFYNSSNGIIETFFNYTFSELSIILPERKSPFLLTLWDQSLSSNIDHYSLSVTFSATDSMPESLRILSNSSYYDIGGGLNIVGEVENTASEGATYVYVIATCYDEYGTVINLGSNSTTDIEAHQQAPFSITISDNNPESVSYYELTVESFEFAAIPEFNSFISVLFILSLFGLTIYVISRNYSKKSLITNVE